MIVINSATAKSRAEQATTSNTILPTVSAAAPAVANAQTDINSAQNNPPKVEDIDHPLANLLASMKSGDWLVAQQKVNDLRSNAHLKNDLHLLFLAAQIAEKNNKLALAIAYYQKMLQIDAKLERPRFEKARLYAVVGDNLAALYQLKRLLKITKDESIKQLTQSAIAALDTTSYQLMASMYFLPSSNINRGSSRETITINGYQFKLSDNSRAKADYGLGTGFNGKIFFANNYRSYVSASYHLNDRRGTQNDNDWRQMAVGHVLKPTLFLQIDCSAGPVWQYYQQRLLAQGTDASCQSSYSFLRYKLLNALGVQQLHYQKKYAHLSGNTLSASVGWQIMLNSQHRLGAFVSYADYRAKSLVDANIKNQISFEYDSMLSQWLLSASLSYSVAKHRRDEPFFQKRRADSKQHSSLGIAHSKLKIFGAYPYLQINYVKNKSSIALYEYDEAYMNINLNKVF